MNKFLGAVAIVALTVATMCGCKKHDYPGDLSPIAVPGSSDTSRNGNGNGGTDTTGNGNNGGNNGGNTGGGYNFNGGTIIWDGTVPVNWNVDLGALQDTAHLIPNILGPGYPITWQPQNTGVTDDSAFLVQFDDSISSSQAIAAGAAMGWRPATFPELAYFLGYMFRGQIVLPIVPMQAYSPGNVQGTYPSEWFVSLGSWTTVQVGNVPANSYLGVGVVKPGPTSAGFSAVWTIFWGTPKYTDASGNIIPAVEWGGYSTASQGGHVIWFLFVKK